MSVYYLHVSVHIQVHVCAGSFFPTSMVCVIVYHMVCVIVYHMVCVIVYHMVCVIVYHMVCVIVCF